MTDKEMTLVICPPTCAAGGDEKDGGHVFSVPYEDGREGGFECVDCGLRNIDFYLMWKDLP